MNTKKHTVLGAFCLGAFCLGIASLAQAGGPEFPPLSHGSGPYVALLGGVGWSHTTKDSTNLTLVEPLLTNRYDFSSASRFAPVVGLDYGYVWSHLGGCAVNISLGLETGYTRVMDLGGRVHPLYLINPGFDTLEFRYAVSSVPLLAVSTLQFPLSSWTPYILGGLGVSWNHASNYHEFPTDPNSGALPMRSPFRSYTRLGFAYTLGAGLSYALTARTDLGLEYRFTNYGKAELNPSTEQSTTNRLPLGTISSHAALLRLSVRLS